MRLFNSNTPLKVAKKHGATFNLLYLEVSKILKELNYSTTPDIHFHFDRTIFGWDIKPYARVVASCHPSGYDVWFRTLTLTADGLMYVDRTDICIQNTVSILLSAPLIESSIKSL